MIYLRSRSPGKLIPLPPATKTRKPTGIRFLTTPPGAPITIEDAVSISPGMHGGEPSIRPIRLYARLVLWWFTGEPCECDAQSITQFCDDYNADLKPIQTVVLAAGHMLDKLARHELPHELQKPVPRPRRPNDSILLTGADAPLDIEDAVWVHPHRKNGTPCFRDTSIPIVELFQWLHDDHTLDEYLKTVPVDPGAAETVLLTASYMLSEIACLELPEEPPPHGPRIFRRLPLRELLDEIEQLKRPYLPPTPRRFGMLPREDPIDKPPPRYAEKPPVRRHRRRPSIRRHGRFDQPKWPYLPPSRRRLGRLPREDPIDKPPPR